MKGKIFYSTARKKFNKAKKLERLKRSNGNINDPQKNKQLQIKQITNTLGSGADNVDSFLSLKGSISVNTLRAIGHMGFQTMTHIQAKSIPKLLEGHDLRGTAKTGSGKTLAFLIPVVELIVKSGFRPSHGTGAIIISPARELAIQTLNVLKNLMKYHRQTCGLLIGGINMLLDEMELEKGINIIIATPGRLLEHLQDTKEFNYSNLKCLVVDEADKILAHGFEKKLKEIIELLPKNRQTMLFRATKSDKTNEIAKLAFKSEFVEVDVDSDKKQATADGLTQYYVVCPLEKRFLFLHSFLKKHENNKMMVFFSTSKAVRFYSELFNHLDIPVRCVHGKQTQEKRSRTFRQFNEEESGILLCTDVASRGLDIPDVAWIIQYDPPDDPKDYIHRVGRTARAGNTGNALLFLSEKEIGFTSYLKKNKIIVDHMKINWSEVVDIQKQVEEIVRTKEDVLASANEAFEIFVKSYRSHSSQDIFHISTLDLTKLGKSFGLPESSDNCKNIIVKKRKPRRHNSRSNSKRAKRNN